MKKSSNNISNSCAQFPDYVISCDYAINETSILKSKSPVNDINLTNYSYEYCRPESSARRTLLFIENYLLYKPRNDFCIYKTAELESTFIELINTKKSNVIVAAIYRYLV